MNRRNWIRNAPALGFGLSAAYAPAAAPSAKLKITRVEVLQPDRFRYVKVHTDAGIAGVGELHPASNTSGKVTTHGVSCGFWPGARP